jgi:hypothetical protein
VAGRGPGLPAMLQDCGEPPTIPCDLPGPARARLRVLPKLRNEWHAKSQLEAVCRPSGLSKSDHRQRVPEVELPVRCLIRGSLPP